MGANVYIYERNGRTDQEVLDTYNKVIKDTTQGMTDDYQGDIESWCFDKYGITIYDKLEADVNLNRVKTEWADQLWGYRNAVSLIDEDVIVGECDFLGEIINISEFHKYLLEHYDRNIRRKVHKLEWFVEMIGLLAKDYILIYA